MRLNAKTIGAVLLCLFGVFAATAGTSSANSVYWADDPGGVYNIPPVNYNEEFHGYGSFDNITYNKIDLQDGRTMYIDRAPLYDNQGNYIADAWASGIGNVDGERDGGIVAGAISHIEIDGVRTEVFFAWSVNAAGSGRTSGWMPTSALTPQADIVNILEDNRDVRMSFINGAIAQGDFQPHTVVETTLPSYMEEYYLDPGRDASYTAGKARFYYTRDDLITPIKNIPETGSQRYGVGHDVAPVGATFYRDMTEPIVNVPIYPPSSHVAESHTLDLAWGYFETNSGDKIYSFVNARGLVADEPSGGETIVHITKRNATGYALDGGNGGANGQSVYLWSENDNNVNQQWIEIDRGNGYVSYQKVGTNFCIDGGRGGERGQAVYLWECDANNRNQQWQRVARGNGTFQLVKRNAAFSIGGGNGGANGQLTNLWESSTTSQNHDWIITVIG